LIFLDTNVLFSSLYSAKGSAGLILDYFIDGKIDVVFSQQVLEEVIRNMKIKIPVALPVFRNLLLDNPPKIIENPSIKEVTQWAEYINFDDAGILAAAVAIQPDFLVTGDRHFFENHQIATESGLRIVTPAQFLNELKAL
jgi:putative PIN family toxin of toxin-antitoxin system